MAQAENAEDTGNQSALTQKANPGIGTHQHIDPHGNCNAKHQDILDTLAAAGDKKRNRIAQKQADDRRLHCYPDGTPEDYQEIRVGKKSDVMIQGEFKGHNAVTLLCHRIHGDQKHRQYQHQCRPYDVRDCKL